MQEVERLCHMFPSPCGVLVLKGIYNGGFTPEEIEGFRPLAGFWFLKIKRGERIDALEAEVSVPLRGSGS